jgi:hypothetical protein
MHQPRARFIFIFLIYCLVPFNAYRAAVTGHQSPGSSRHQSVIASQKVVTGKLLGRWRQADICRASLCGSSASNHGFVTDCDLHLRISTTKCISASAVMRAAAQLRPGPYIYISSNAKEKNDHTAVFFIYKCISVTSLLLVLLLVLLLLFFKLQN